MLTTSEQAYLKVIYKNFEKTRAPISTNSIASSLKVAPASATVMIRKLADKQFLKYIKYHGVQLSPTGIIEATDIIRRHRLWKSLLDHIGMHWDEIDEIAETLCFLKDEKLIDTIDEFLSIPKFDPHGDPIPDSDHKFILRSRVPLIDTNEGDHVEIVGVLDQSRSFLQLMDEFKLKLGTKLRISEKFEFNASIKIQIDGTPSTITISGDISKNIIIKPLSSIM